MVLTKAQRLKNLKKGRDKLKQLRKQHKANMKRTKGRVHQTGSSNTIIDLSKKAKKPGYRTSKNGNRYYEARRNRSDIPPGKL